MKTWRETAFAVVDLEHSRHHALGDALTTAQVFIVLAEQLTTVAGRDVTVAQLRKAGARLERESRRAGERGLRQLLGMRT